MRISDWSSDVCSSGLAHRRQPRQCGGDRSLQLYPRRTGAGRLRFADQRRRQGVDADRAARRRTVEPGLQRLRFLRRSEEHTSELQSLMRISYAVFCLKKKIKSINETA